jgi:hypothetical protein
MWERAGFVIILVNLLKLVFVDILTRKFCLKIFLRSVDSKAPFSHLEDSLIWETAVCFTPYC